jgi:hypothetical protein
LKEYRSPGSDQILAELIQAGVEALFSGIHKFNNSIRNKEELPYLRLWFYIVGNWSLY